MSKLSIKQILENSLTNISIKPNVNNQDNLTKNLVNPINNFIDKEQKLQSQKIRDNNKIKSVIHNPEEKKIKDKQIKDGQLKLQQIKQLKDSVTANLMAIEKQQAEQQKAIQAQIEKIQSSVNDSNDSSQENQFESEKINVKKFDSLPMIKRRLTTQSMNETAPIPTPHQTIPQPANIQPPAKKKSYRVKFDTKTQTPWEALFTERGFKIGDTRISFEDIDTALSKNYIIILDGGQGLTLDAIKMQKILKYRNRF